MKTPLAISFVVSAALATTPAGAVPQHGHAHAPRAANKQAPQTATQIEVLVIEGSNGPGGIAAGLQNLPQLRRPPFSSYTQMNLVSRTTLPLGATPSNASLPNGSAAITSQGRLPNGRYQVTVQLTLAGHAHNLQFSATPGDPFFTARSTGADSALILGFIVR